MFPSASRITNSRKGLHGTFEDRVFRSGLGAYMEDVGWGVHLADVDHDGRRDLVMINGHVYPQVEQRPELHYRQPRLLYWNVGGGKFKDLSSRAGSGIREAWASRGSAVGDLDNDGSPETVISNMGARPSLLKNFAAVKNWLLVQCIGTRANRDAIGARIYVYAGGRRLSGEIQSQSGFISHSDSRVHFGLADSAGYDRVEVQWPGGGREDFPGGQSNRIVRLTQGSGSPARAGKSPGAGRPQIW